MSIRMLGREIKACMTVLSIFINAIIALLLRPWMKKCREELGPLPRGSMGWPFLGETLQLIAAFRTSDPDYFFIDIRRKRHGMDLFKTHLLGKPTIFVTSPEINKIVLQNEGRLFASSYPKTLATLLGKHSLLLTPFNYNSQEEEEDLHKKLYRLTRVTLTTSHLRQNLFPRLVQLVQTTLQTWAHHQLIFLQDEAKKITFNLSLCHLLSISPCEWTEMVRQDYLQLVDGFFCLPIQLPGTTYSNALQARARVAKKVKEVIGQRRNRKELDGRLSRYDDLLELLLDEKKKSGATDDEIVDVIVSMLVAGYETTSMIITLAVKFLTESEEALLQLRAEHNMIRSGKQRKDEMQLNWNDYKSMTFTQNVITETLRLGNVVGGVFRKALQDVQIKDYVIPKDWIVFVCFRAVHLDEELYGFDARKFNPWRWQGDRNSMYANFSPNLTPFGGGPRLCPGYELARLQVSIFLHYFVTYFSWGFAEKDTISFFPTTRMVKRLPITLKRL